MLKTDTIVVNMGPQHPSTHGVFRMVVTLDGERVVNVDPVVGYLHRGVEKLAERGTYLQFMPLTDRNDYICAMNNNLGYAVAVEKLAGIAVPERAEYIRVIMAELGRIVNHLILVGFLLNDLGAFFTPVLYCLREREKILDLFEMASGSRMTCNYMRFGGVAADLPEEFLPRARKLVASFPAFIDELEALLSTNEILVARTRGVGVLPADAAINGSITGPMLRASGVRYDIRRVEPYSIYDRFDFQVPALEHGDSYDRYMLRILEMRQSVRILEQALAQIPAGEIQTRLPKAFRPAPGEAYARTESPKGELGYYVVSDGSGNPYRIKIRPPSFINISILSQMSVGWKVADLITILGSIDIILGEVDR